ncbi:TetR/AcrR family transcriptional regulator [Phyllobacterium sp. 628]|uniref:TetR/AcrR family transcriptional regulator n=1 Tax=Phyllobacterium sp. 628 TaxID=2718938 RepID=UPI0016625F40|nr:TetR/AcrR family transcriptional regulator [Phyllobacterium sp. 628]QND51310.1 TetR/AcrR family transcriptional regulator [Phyllobacterium sp. 628]
MRSRILDVAADLFQRRGYNSTSVQDVVQAALATGGAVHHHFPTKKALGLAVIEERVAKEVNATAIQPVLQAIRVKTGILAFFASVADELERNQAVTGCPLNNLAMELSLADPDFRHAANAIFENWRGALTQRLQAGGSGLASKPAGELATTVVAAYSGAMAMAKASQSAQPLRDCAAQLEKLLP